MFFPPSALAILISTRFTEVALIAASAAIIIDGEVVGNVTTANNLRIGKGAFVKAKIEAKNAYIAGKIIGNITVQDKLKLTDTASIKGNINAKLLDIEQGASLVGQCKVSSNDELIEEKQVKENK